MPIFCCYCKICKSKFMANRQTVLFSWANELPCDSFNISVLRSLSNWWQEMVNCFCFDLDCRQFVMFFPSQTGSNQDQNKKTTISCHQFDKDLSTERSKLSQDNSFVHEKRTVCLLVIILSWRTLLWIKFMAFVRELSLFTGRGGASVCGGGTRIFGVV